MYIIVNISDTQFSLNGIPYWKNYVPSVYGNKLIIHSAYDRNDEKTDLSNVDQFTVDGASYASAALLQAALLPVLYNRNFGSGGTSSREVKVISQSSDSPYTIESDDKNKSLVLSGDAAMELIFTSDMFSDNDELQITNACDGEITFTNIGSFIGNTACPLGCTMFLKRAMDLWIINYRFSTN